MVAVSFITSSSSSLDARSARLLFDIEKDEPVGDPQVSAVEAAVNLQDGSILRFDGDFAALQQALQSGDLELLFLVLPQIRIDTISKSFPGGDAVLVTGLGIKGDELLPFFDEDAIEGGFQHFLRGNDTFVGHSGQESLAGYAGNDILLGMNGNDLLEGGPGNDEINGNRGEDIVHGGPDQDFVRGGQENDRVLGGDGDDWHVNGNNDADTVDGGLGNDIIHGGKGDDVLLGGQGDDFVSGDLGNDTLVGEQDRDTFVFDSNSGLDRVLDFHPELGDRIGIRTDANGVPLRTGADVLSRATQAEEGTVLDLGNDNLVVLEQVMRADLRADFFIIF